ncbi:hypothetical protein VTN31DRAFT_854 [Thermomyces dupontii]|uniref:uncharacterized protein n=1 Tax=Talaromyces thermophilus TaxID=28565 RepID=UPI0037429AD6
MTKSNSIQRFLISLFLIAAVFPCAVATTLYFSDSELDSTCPREPPPVDQCSLSSSHSDLFMFHGLVRAAARSSPLRPSLASNYFSRPFSATRATMASTSTEPSTQSQPEQQQGEQPQDQTPKQLPALPSVEDATGAKKLDVSSGGSVALDELGPLVVNQDGTVSRIANWDKMTEIEKRNTLRVLGKRNRERMEALKAKQAAEGNGENNAEGSS